MIIKSVNKEKDSVDFLVEATGADWDKLKEKALVKAGKRVKIEGFRPGKVPVSILKKQISLGSYLSDAINDAAETALDTIYDDKSFIEKAFDTYSDFPNVSLKDANEEKVSFLVSFYLLPKVKLNLEKIKLTTKKEEVTEKQIQEKIDQQLSADEMMIPKDGPIAKNDIAVINFKGFVDNEPFAGGEAKNYELKIGSKTFIDNFEDQLIGLKAGDKKDVLVTFPKDYNAKHLANKQAKFEVEVNAVNQVEKAKLDDAFVVNLKIENVKTVAEWKKHLEKELKAANENNFKANITNEFIQQLLNTSAFERDANNNVIEKTLNKRLNIMLNQFQLKTIDEFKQLIAKFGMNYDDYINREKSQIENDVRLRAILLEYATSKNIKASDDEYNSAVDEFIKNSGITKKDVDESELLIKRLQEQADIKKGYSQILKQFNIEQ